MKFLPFIFYMLFWVHKSEAQNWLWAERIYGTGNTEVRGLDIDTLDEVYMTGYFDGDLSVKSVLYATTHGLKDIFVCRYDKNGDSLVWVNTIGSKKDDDVQHLKTNVAGDVFITGTFRDTCHFDSNDLIATDDSSDIFIAKYKRNGDLDWTRKVAWGPGEQTAEALTFDPSGNIIIVGTSADTIYFDNDTLIGSEHNLYIAKYDKNGLNKWAKMIRVSSGTSGKLKFVEYSNNGFYTGGFFSPKIYFESDSATAKGSMDDIIFHYDQDGNINFVRQGGYTAMANRILGGTVDQTGNLYITGFVSTKVTLDSTAHEAFNAHTITSKGNQDVFVAKYNNTGVLQWVLNNGGSSADVAYDVDFDYNQVVISGYTSTTSYWGNDTLVSTAKDPFVSYISPEGTILGAKKMKGIGGSLQDDRSLFVVADSKGNFVTSGYFQSSYLIYGSDTLKNQNIITPSKDIFFAKYGCNMILGFSSTKSCPLDNTGKITVSVTGEGSPYTYNWSNGDKTATADTLGKATYYVTVTNTYGCKTIGSYILGEYPKTFHGFISVTNTTNPVISDGAIDLDVWGSPSPYLYNWSNTQTTQDINSLSFGKYIVTITDANLCSTVDSTVVNYGCNITMAFYSKNACHDDDNGLLAATVLNGVAPYDFIWSNGDTVTFADTLSAGWYYVTVTDSFLCSVSDSAQILDTDISLSLVTTDATDPFTADGSVDLTVSGGTSPYTYNWSNSATTQDISLLNYGMYTVDVLDSNGCSKTDSAYIDFTCIISVGFISSNDCDSSGSGSITSTVSDGISPYIYNWNSGHTNAVITGLYPKRYILTLTDSLGCVVIDSVDIAEFDPNIGFSVLDASDEYTSDGEIDLTVTGGSGSYSYLWNNLETTEDITGLAYDWYTLVITDNVYNCSATDSAYVDFVTGIKNNKNTGIAIFPNPSRDKIFVTNASGRNVILYNHIGEAIIERTINADLIEIDISELPVGQYIIRIEQYGNFFSKKINIER